MSYYSVDLMACIYYFTEFILLSDFLLWLLIVICFRMVFKLEYLHVVKILDWKLLPVNTKHVNFPPLSPYASFIRDGESAYCHFLYQNTCPFKPVCGRVVIHPPPQRCKSLNLAHCKKRNDLDHYDHFSGLMLQETSCKKHHES